MTHFHVEHYLRSETVLFRSLKDSSYPKLSGARHGTKDMRGDEINTCTQASMQDQSRWTFAFCAIILGTFAANLAFGLQEVFGLSQQTVSLACKALILVSLLPCLSTLLRLDITPMILTVFVAFACSIIQIVLFPSLNPWFLSVLSDFVTLCLPMMFCLYMIDDYKMLMRRLATVSILISSIISVLMLTLGGALFSHYSMGFSNVLVIPINTLIFSASHMYRGWKRVACVVLAAADCFAILAYGSRGALVAVVVYLVYTILFRESMARAEIVRKMLACAAIVFVAVFFQDIVIILDSILRGVGFSSRTLSLLSVDTMHDSGRFELWRIIWEDCMRDPLAIRGICSEYPLIGIYCHSIVLGLWHNLGLFLGTVFLLFIAVQMIGTVFVDAKSDRDAVAMILMSSFFPVVLWSLNFWSNTGFWSWVALRIKRRGARVQDTRVNEQNGTRAETFV